MRISSEIRFSQVYDNYEDTKNIEPFCVKFTGARCF